MSRITKDPQIRIAEFLDAAENLFTLNGYQETQISEIVKAVGVAQGTFYYYFKSKEEILEAIVRRKVNNILSKIEEVANSFNIMPPDKINLTINETLSSIHNRGELLFGYLHNDQYLHILDRIGRQSRELFAPLLSKIIAEGRQQGHFHVSNSEVAADFIIAITKSLIDSLYKKEPVIITQTRLNIACGLIENILGSKKFFLSLKY